AMAREGHPGPVTVCMTGGHGEWFVQDFAADGLPEAPLASLTPTEARERDRHVTVAGSQAAALGGGMARDILPDARRFDLLPASLLTADLSPIYGRPPDARLPGAAR